MPFVNRRFDEFLNLEQPVWISEEEHVVPAASPFYVALNEIPIPGSVTCRIMGAGSSSVTLSPPIADAWTDQSFINTNHGTNTFVAAGRDDAGLGSWIYRGLFKFDLASGPALATSAKLRVYRETGQGAPQYGVYRITADWSEGTVTHSNQPAVDPVAVNDFSITAGVMGWYEVDITDLYNAWKDGTYSNFGLELRTEEIDTNTVSNFTSREGTSGQRPQIVVASAGTLAQELGSSIAPAAGEFAIHYGTGRLRFNVADATKVVHVTYQGTGSPISVEDIWVVPPASSTAKGRKGQRAFDASYIYFCIEDNQWVRTAVAGW